MTVDLMVHISEIRNTASKIMFRFELFEILKNLKWRLIKRFIFRKYEIQLPNSASVSTFLKNLKYSKSPPIYRFAFRKYEIAL